MCQSPHTCREPPLVCGAYQVTGGRSRNSRSKSIHLWSSKHQMSTLSLRHIRINFFTSPDIRPIYLETCFFHKQFKNKKNYKDEIIVLNRNTTTFINIYHLFTNWTYLHGLVTGLFKFLVIWTHGIRQDSTAEFWLTFVMALDLDRSHNERFDFFFYYYYLMHTN